jgi:hypothetical protein
VCSIIFYDTVCECNTRERAEVQERVALRASAIRSSLISKVYFSAFDGRFASLIIFWLLTSCRIMFVPKFRRKVMPRSSGSLNMVQLDAEQHFPPRNVGINVLSYMV